MRLAFAYLSIKEAKLAPRFGAAHTETKLPNFTLAELNAGVKKGIFTTIPLKNTPGQTIAIYAPTAAYFNQPHLAIQKLHLFNVWYVEQQGTSAPITKEAHDYKELYRYAGQIYDFLVHTVLNYNGHKVLAQAAMNIANKHNLNTTDTVILDMGAGHGPDLQELRKQGFEGKVFGLDICEAAKTALNSKDLHDFLTPKYNDYYVGELARDRTLREKVAKNPPDITIIGSMATNEAAEDIKTAIKHTKTNGFIIINLPKKEAFNEKCYALFEDLCSKGFLKKLSSTSYQHRTHLNGDPLFFDCFTYKILKPAQ